MFSKALGFFKYKPGNLQNVLFKDKYANLSQGNRDGLVLTSDKSNLELGV